MDEKDTCCLARCYLISPSPHDCSSEIPSTSHVGSAFCARTSAAQSKAARQRFAGP